MSALTIVLIAVGATAVIMISLVLFIQGAGGLAATAKGRRRE